MLFDEKFNHFSSKEFFLYMLLLNRMNISKKNMQKFSDSKGIFVYYSIEKIMNDVRCSRSTAINIVHNLENSGLIHKEYQKNGLPVKIYVNDIRSQKIKEPMNENRSPPSNTAYVHIETSDENKKKMRQNFGTKKHKRHLKTGG